MITLTRAQRIALKELFDRGPIYKRKWATVLVSDLVSKGSWKPEDHLPRMSYREFRATVQLLLAGSSCILVPWKGMTVGIEPDGHTHT